jgi:DNA-binding GntR family transcriptional regulator
MILPYYRILMEELKKPILQGFYHDGDLLPSENELCEQHHITRSTVRKALDELVNQGYITKQKGRGSVVNYKRKSLALLGVKGFSEVVTDTCLPVRTNMIISPYKTEWGADFAFTLSPQELEAGCIYLKRLRYAGDMPVMVENTYLPDNNLKGFCNLPFINASLFETLNVIYNIEIVNVEQDIRAVKADDTVAALLGMPEGEPVLQVYVKFLTKNRDFSIYSILFCNTANFSVSNTLI